MVGAQMLGEYYSRISFVLISCLAVCLCGCGGKGAAPSTSPAVITVQPQSPTLQLSANPPSIAEGQVTTLSWTSKNATAISFTPPLPLEDQQLPLNGTTELNLLQT